MMAAVRWLDRHFEEMVCCTCLALIAIAVFAQVVARYVFQVALHWTEETAAICMVWAVYMGASLCVRERFHIRILVVVQALPKGFGQSVTIVADLVWAAFCLFMMLVSWRYLTVLWRFPEISPSLGINQFYPQTILVFGYGMMLFRLMQTYVGWWRDGCSIPPGMGPEGWGDRADQDSRT